MQWLANLLADAQSVYLSGKGSKSYWRISGCQIRLIEEDLHLGGRIDGNAPLEKHMCVEILLDSSKIDLIDLELDIIEDAGSRYLNASSIPGVTKVLYLTKTEDDRPRVTIERTFRNHD